MRQNLKMEHHSMFNINVAPYYPYNLQLFFND